MFSLQKKNLELHIFCYLVYERYTDLRVLSHLIVLLNVFSPLSFHYTQISFEISGLRFFKLENSQALSLKKSSIKSNTYEPVFLKGQKKLSTQT